MKLRVAVATCLAALLALTTFYSSRINPALLTGGALSVELAAATDAVTRGPYLQMGTASSVVVRWRTNNPTDSLVAYGLDPANLVWTASLAPLTTEHEVVVSGLLPFTKYSYAVGTTAQRLAGGDSNHSFVTSPLPGTAVPTRVWVLGDSGTADANAASVRNGYYSFSGSTPPNLWLMLGDNAYNGGTDSEYQAAVFDMFPSTLRQSVLWPTIGNHDIANTAQGTGPYYSIFTLPKNAEAGGLPSGTEAYYSFDYGNIHFICLDSFDVDLSAGAPMMTWLQNDLASTASRWTVAFWHHPPYSKGSHDSDVEYELVQMRQNALPLLEAAGVDLVLAGHSHSYERSFLIDGHYGASNTFSGTMKKDGGSGRENGAGAYTKPATTPAPHAGAVYTVAGSSGFAGGGALNHPAMFISLNVMGSLVLDVNGGRLDARFVDSASVVRDYFTILKGTPPLVLTTASLTGGTVGTTYSQILAATGGVTPYTWSVPVGSLPAGLSLDAATGAISGTPTTAGPAVFTAQVRDSSSPQLIAERQFSVSIANALIVVPDVQNLTQAAAVAALTSAGLTQGTVTPAPSPSVPSGSVVSQSPAAGSLASTGSAVDLVISTGLIPVVAPVAIGSQIAGTFADATGHSAQSHLVYAANAGVWWLFTLSSDADSNPANHVVKAYRSSGSNLATATWIAATPSPGASTAASVNCGGCIMGDGRALSVAYVNNAPTDAVHVEVAMGASGQNGLTGHIRATVTATSIGWEAWNYRDAESAAWTRPRATSLGVSTGKFIHSGGPTLQQGMHANARMSTRADISGTWTTGFSTVSLIDDTMFHTSSAMAFAPLANNIMLAVYDNGGGASPCYQCSGGVPEPSLSNLRFKKSNAGGAWPTIVAGSVLGGDGRVFSTDATIDQNDWALVARDATTIYAFRSNAAATGIDAAAYAAETNTWAAFTAPPLFGAGQALKKGAGVFGAATGSNIWLFVVNTDAANSILSSAFNGTTWTPWTAISGTGNGTHTRKFISGYPVPVGNQIGLMWTEGTTQNDVVVMAFAANVSAIVPNVVNMTQSAATTAITGAGLVVGTVGSALSFTVPAGSVISQNPVAASQVVAGSAVSLIVSSGAPVSVPDVVNLTQAAASTAITTAGLVVGTVGNASSATVPAGSVISQNPVAPTQVASGSAVNFVVSTGPVLVAVPHVVNLTQAAASTAIANADLVVGTVGSASSPTVPAGSVISQNPVAATQIATGSAVDVVVSTGPVLVEVPDVVNLTQGAASAAITGAGLVVGTVGSASSLTVPAGSVISQNPAAASQAVAGSAVNLIVSSGTPVPVPDVVNLTQAAASTAITNAGLVVGTVSNASSATVPVGSVISQNPVAPTQVASGSAVNLVVSTGPVMVAAPNVVNLTQSAANTAITTAGLIVGTVGSASSATVPAGSVISQNPVAPTQVAEGSAVNLVVSTGPPVAVVPNVIDLTLAAASTAIANAGLIVGTVSSASNATVPAGSVIGQDPVAAAQIVAGSAVNLTVSSGAPVSVPDVVNLAQAAASTAITNAGLVIGTVSNAPSPTVPAGSVISQHPVAATQVEAGSAVTLVVSTGPVMVAVPNIVNLTQAAASTAITSAGLIVGTVGSAASPTVPAGSVISQNPVAPTQVAEGSAVNLIVSTGPVLVAVPDVVDLTQAAASTAITNAGLIVGTVGSASSLTVPAGSVISQNPVAASQVAEGSAVNLTVSSGAPVPVPDVVNLTQAAASTAITNAGLVVGTVGSASSATVPAGSVISQSPVAPTQVALGSSVNLVVSTGPMMVAVPNVVNLTQAAASTAITNAGLVVGTVGNASSATVPAGSVISQSPVAPTPVASGSAVNIVVSTGPAPLSPTVDIVVFSDGQNTRNTAAFSTSAAGDVLLAFVAADGPAASPQIVTVSGAGLTWTLVRRANVQAGTSEIWQAKAVARLTGVTVRSTLSVNGYRQSLTVVAFRGSTGIGASAIANASTGAPSVSLVTTKANSLVYGVGNDWDRAVARTLGAGQVMVHQRLETSVGDTFWVQSRNAPVPAAGSSVQLNDTAPINDRWNFASVEIVP